MRRPSSSPECESALVPPCRSPPPSTSMPISRPRSPASKAGDLLDGAMRGAIKPQIAYARRPMLEGADGGRTDVEPMISLLGEIEKFESEPGILDISINAGFAQA